MKSKKEKFKRKGGFRLSPLVISLLSVYPQASAFAQGIVVDPSQNNGLNVTVTANDTPLIQIADPNAKGISHNKFTDFNVSNPGAIFNNSMEDGISQIGGMAIKNPNLTQAATGIITEVTGAKASRLEGTLEVFGQQADLIIANENGIIVNGVSTINTGHLTLSTGQVQQLADGNYMLSVERGNVSVESGGISTADLDYFDIVSRSATLTGSISGKADVKVLTGLNDYDPKSRSHDVRATSGSGTPEVAISGSSMGSMYGSRIQLISTESGAGVRHEGSIVSTSDIEISASGDISLAGLKAGQDIVISGENINQLNAANSSGFSAQRDLFIDALNQLTLRAGLVSQEGKIRIDAASLLQQASLIQANATATDVNTITINVMGNYVLSGSLSAVDANGNTISNAVITLRNGSYVVTVNGQAVTYSTVISDVGVNAKQGNISIQSGSIDNQQGSIVAAAGTIAFNVSDVFNSGGVIKAKGDIALVSRSLVNSGLAWSSSKLNINVSDLVNSGALASDDSMHLLASNTLDNSGLVYSDKSVVAKAKNITNTGEMVSQSTQDITSESLINSGKIHAAGNINLNIDSSLVNGGSGEIVSAENLVIKGQNMTIDNIDNATIQARKLTLTGVSSLNNADSAQLLISEQLSISRLNNLYNSGLIYGADLDLSGIDSFLNDGQLMATNRLLLLANSVNNSGLLQSNNQLSINASQVHNTGGTLQSGGELQIVAEQLQNLQDGKLFSVGDMMLTLTQVLNNSTSLIASNGTLILKGVDNARTLKISNSDGAEISATNIEIISAAGLINTDSIIGAADNLAINGLDSLLNTGDAFIQADVIAVSDVDHITNSGVFYSGSQLTLENAESLENAGQIVTDGDLVISMVKAVNNTDFMYAGGSLQISDASVLTNSGEIIANRLTLKDIASIENRDAAIQAVSQLDIQKVENLKNSGLIYSGNKLTIEDVVTFINASASEAETEALVVAEVEMVIQRINELINSGDTAVINASRNLQLLDIAQLANSERAVINANLVLILDKVGVLTNLSAATISSQNGSVSINADSITNSGNYIDRFYDAEGNLVNEVYYSSLLYAQNQLAIETGKLTNADGGLVATNAGDIYVSATSLDNIDESEISARGTLILDVVNTINNKEATLYGTDLAITANQLINNEGGNITATNNALLKLNSLVHDGGRIAANKNLQLDINDDFLFGEKSINANANLIINSTGNITNGTKLENYGNLVLNADGDVVNKTNSSLVSASGIYITAANFTNEENTLLWSLGDLVIDVRDGAFINKQNGNIYSNKAMALIAKSLLNHAGYIKSTTDMFIDAQELVNKSIYDSSGWSLADRTELSKTYEYKTSGIYSNQDTVWLSLPMWQSDITLVGKAEIRSGGNLYINQRDIYSNSKVTNTGGLLSSTQDMFIKGDLLNEPEYITMTILEYLKNPVAFAFRLEHVWYGGVTTKRQNAYFNNLYDLLNYVYGNGSSPQELDKRDEYYYALLGIEKSNNPFEQVMTRLFGETWRNLSYATMKNTWASLIQNNGKKISDEVVYFLPSDTGSITSGGSFVHTGGSFSNGISNGGVVNVNTVNEVEIGDKTVNSTDVGAQVVVNQKQLGVVGMGISTMPTVAQLTSIPGMFGSSESFKNLALGMDSPEELGKVGAIVVIIGDSSLTVVPMYETRLSMIDKSQFYGSDYFFKQIGYVSETPVTVIGDSYFINELINRQVSTSIGSFFAVRDGLDGEALVKELMDNASKVADDMGLVVGEPLTEEQRNNLTEDIVWFITNQVDGYQVLTPIVYLSAQSQQQLKEGGSSAVVHANKDVYIDATSITSSNGLISANNNAILKSEGDIIIASSGQNGGVSAGNNLLMESDSGDITVSGSYLESGNNMIIKANEGDVSFIASMDRDEQGNQKLHSNRDDISAGTNLVITGKNVDFNAVDVSAGENAWITATDGSVSFNSLSEITSDRDVTFENNGLFSDERTDKQSITAEAITSNINVGGNLSVSASEDIIIEGSEMTAASGDMTAGNDIIIKTAEDVSWEKTTVEKNELVFGAGASGFGHSADTSSSTVDGTSNSTSTGYENNSPEGGNSAGRGKSNGAAEIPASAEFKAGFQKTTETTETQSTTNHNASINFGSSGSFTAGNTVDIGGGDFTMDSMSIDATTVASTKYVDETKTTTSSKQEFWGVSGEAHSAVADAGNKYTNMGMETASGDEDKEVNGGEVTASIIGDGTNMIFNDAVGGSTSIGYKGVESGSTTVTGKENITNINVGNLTIKSKDNTELNGVVINADEVNMAVGGNLDINSAKSWEVQESWSATNSAGVSQGAGAGVTGAGAGVSVDYSHYEEKSNSESLTHTNSQINAGNVNITVGGDMTMAGANIKAGEADIDVGGDLNIISQQDIFNSTGSSWQAGGSVGVSVSTSGIIPTFSGGGGGGSEYRNEALTGEQSGITTSGTVNIKTGNDLNLTGGHIVSENGTGSVDVGGDINAITLEDYIEQDGLYGGGSGGIDKKGGVVASGYVKTIDEVHYKEEQNATISVGNVTTGGEIKGDLNTDTNNMSNVTEDRVIKGNDTSWTIGGNLPGSGKGSGSATTPTPDSNSGNSSNTPGNGSNTTPGNGGNTTPGNGGNTTPENGGNTTPENGSNTTPGNGSDANSGNGSGDTTDSGNSKGNKPDGNTVHDSPSKVPDTGNSSSSAPSIDNSIKTDNPSGNNVFDAPSNVPDSGNSSSSNPSTDNSTTLTPDKGNTTTPDGGTHSTKPKSKWTLSPQGNLKGGNNVGTIKDTDAIRKGREKWKAEYDKRNSLNAKEE